VTIAEAAHRLGVPETTLRRALRTLPEYAVRTRSQRHQTATGERVATVLPPDLVADLAEHFARLEAARKPAENSARNATTTPPRTEPQEHQNDAKTTPKDGQNGTMAAFDPAGNGELPAQAYREIIARLERENSRLWEALRQQQEATQLAQHNLAREQALRSLPAPPPVVETRPPTVPEGSRAGDGSESEHQGGPGDSGASGGEKQQARRAWWPWRRRKGT
jgi:hypothetical protein